MTEPLDTDWAYAAGIVDGEGCIAVVRFFAPRRGRFYYGVQLVISNNDPGVLAWVRDTFGGIVTPLKSTRHGRAKASWQWRCSTTLARSFLRGIRPWLKVKNAQCENAMAMADLLLRSKRTLGRLSLPPEWLAEQEKHYWIQRELNHRGTDEFEAKPMHSPRRISRLRASPSFP